MHYSTFIATMAAMTGVAKAVDMTYYEPGPGVDANFTEFYTALQNQADDPASTTGYSDYFPVDGVQQTLDLVAIGAEAIIKQKQYFLPPTGEKFIHFPNTTTLNSENTTARVYEAHGRIERTFEKYNNCSVVYYKTQYTILKDESGEMDWTPGNGQVYMFNDYVVSPATSGPTNIACG